MERCTGQASTFASLGALPPDLPNVVITAKPSATNRTAERQSRVSLRTDPSLYVQRLHFVIIDSSLNLRLTSKLQGQGWQGQGQEQQVWMR